MEGRRKGQDYGHTQHNQKTSPMERHWGKDYCHTHCNKKTSHMGRRWAKTTVILIAIQKNPSQGDALDQRLWLYSLQYKNLSHREGSVVIATVTHRNQKNLSSGQEAGSEFQLIET